MSNIFLATKRAPFEYELDATTGQPRPAISAGGTASVVADQAQYLRTNWISSAMSEADQEMARRHPDGIDLGPLGIETSRLFLLRHEAQTFERFQHFFTADVLWRTIHGLWETWRAPNFESSLRRGWEAYETTNEQFARALADAASRAADPLFLIHDYQLLCVSSYLRPLVGASKILSFSHLPWPSADTWRILPSYVRGPMLERALAADVIGFFAHRWVWNFLCCVEDNVQGARISYHNGEVAIGRRITRVRAMPLGYSPSSLRTRPPQLGEELEQWVGSRRLVVHAGRTDPIKNAPRAVGAFAAARERDDAVQAARMLVKMNPNRLYVDVNAAYLDETRRVIDAVNANAGEECIRLVLDNDVGLTLGSLARADLIFLNSILDGQNLTAFEGSILNDRHADLVLSEGCGAAEALGDVAAIINPFNIDEQADALIEGLTRAPEDAQMRSDRRRAVALEYPLPRWVDQQLSELRLSDAPESTIPSA
jgi:validamine 7-phosphate valienyltransferase